MRLRLLVSLVALLSSCGAVFVASNSENTGVATLNSDFGVSPRALEQAKRSLRQYDDEATTTERRMQQLGGVIEKLGPKVDDVIAKVVPKSDDVTEKMDDAVAKILQKEKSLPKNVNAAAVEKVAMSADEVEATMKKVMAKYPEGLSANTWKQIDDVEKMRRTDLTQKSMTKETGDGMRRKMDPFPGMKTAPEEYMVSHVGRDLQRMEGKTRLLSCNVVSHEGKGQVLLISSSNPAKNDWILPKGGWDKGETVEKAAFREVIEEGGVKGQLTQNLGKLSFTNKDGKSYRYYGFKLKSNTVYDQWAESVRYRIWVSYDDAKLLLANRPEMLNIVKRAQLSDDLTRIHNLPAVDPKLAKLKFD